MNREAMINTLALMGWIPTEIGVRGLARDPVFIMPSREGWCKGAYIGGRPILDWAAFTDAELAMALRWVTAGDNYDEGVPLWT